MMHRDRNLFDDPLVETPKAERVRQRIAVLRAAMPDIPALEAARIEADQAKENVGARHTMREWRDLPSSHPDRVAWLAAVDNSASALHAYMDAANIALAVELRIRRLQAWLRGEWDGSQGDGEDTDVLVY